MNRRVQCSPRTSTSGKTITSIKIYVSSSLIIIVLVAIDRCDDCLTLKSLFIPPGCFHIVIICQIASEKKIEFHSTWWSSCSCKTLLWINVKEMMMVLMMVISACHWWGSSCYQPANQVDIRLPTFSRCCTSTVWNPPLLRFGISVLDVINQKSANGKNKGKCSWIFDKCQSISFTLISQSPNRFCGTWGHILRNRFLRILTFAHWPQDLWYPSLHSQWPHSPKHVL